MSTDRSWMYRRVDNRGFINPEFRNGVLEFVDFAFSQLNYVFENTIRCPCANCDNREFHTRDDVLYHLLSKGFTTGYSTWFAHGDTLMANNQDRGESSSNRDRVNDYHRMVIDAGCDELRGNETDINRENFVEEMANSGASRFFSLLRAADEPLWEGCTTQTKLSCVSQLLNVKSESNMSNALYDRMMSVIKTMLPKNDKLPRTFYKAKKMLSKLGLGYQKIHACRNNCMLFYKETESLLECSTCGQPRYKSMKKKGRKQIGIPYKVLRYLPLTPRLQRLYMSSKTAKHMRWHASNRSPEGELRHPVDSEAWKHLDSAYPSFAEEVRNVRLGLCSDGFNPFGPNAKPYSCWPVIIVVYNLPPWMCMKKPFMFLNMIIPGPNSPGKHIDVFLRPLIDELKLLWNVGVETYDSFRKQNFQLRAALLWTINDFPAYGMLSGWSTHGRLACPYCMERTKAFQLKHGGKTSFFDCHRQFLPSDHAFRRQRDKFKMRVENDEAIERPSRDEMLRRVSELPEITFGTKSGKQTIEGFGRTHNWVKKSIFWELPYWDKNLVPNILDVMHVEKNVFDNVFNTVMNVQGKSKDNVKSRLDLKLYCKRPELELQTNDDGKVYMPTATYTLNPAQKQLIFEWLKQLKFPDGYVSNIGNCVNVEKKQISGLKSHDCHVFMQRLLPIALCDFLPKPIWDALTELCHFFRDICSTELRVQDLEILEKKIVETLCKLEKIFPPSFFDSMEHLVVHLAYEAKVCGPVHYRWMYPFERFLHHLKKFVRNRHYVEGSICEAYLIEEISTFCSRYFDVNVQTQHTQPPRNDDGGEVEQRGRLSIFTHPGKSIGAEGSRRFLSDDEYNAAEMYVLKNCPDIAPYIEQFDEEARSICPGISEDELEKYREKNFPSWLRNFVHLNSSDVDCRIYELARGPSHIATSYKGFNVNGFKFLTEQYGKDKQTMNCGVYIKGSCYNDSERDFFGVLVDIIELEYFGEGNKVVLFKCRWFDITRGVQVHPRHGLVKVNHKSRLASNEPFVLASQAQQLYYSTYPLDKGHRENWWAVYKVKARSSYEGVSNIDVETENEEEDSFYQGDRFGLINISSSTPLDRDVSLTDGNLEELGMEDVEMEAVDGGAETNYEGEEEVYEGEEEEGHNSETEEEEFMSSDSEEDVNDEDIDYMDSTSDDDC